MRCIIEDCEREAICKENDSPKCHIHVKFETLIEWLKVKKKVE